MSMRVFWRGVIIISMAIVVSTIIRMAISEAVGVWTPDGRLATFRAYFPLINGFQTWLSDMIIFGVLFFSFLRKSNWNERHQQG